MGRAVRVFATLLTVGVVLAGAGGCTAPGPPPGTPFGHLDSANLVDGVVRVDGWAIDPDTTGPVEVRVLVDGALYDLAVARVPRPDVGAAHGMGNDHGFSIPLPSLHGAHFVCVQVTNVGPGADGDLGCLVGNAPNPYGFADISWSEPAGIRVRGWARDPDMPGPISVTVTRDYDTSHIARVTADSAPPAASSTFTLFPVDSAGHSFEVFIPAVYDGRSHEVVVTAENVGAGTSTELTHQTGYSWKGSPFGEVTRWDASDPQRLRVSGWAIDPDSAAPVTVTVDNDGSTAVVPADLPRDDLPAAFTSLGRNHGFETTVPLTRGLNIVCVTVQDTAGQGNVLDCSAIINR
jgi:hypothetical protein